jgi:hypothetical protein
LVTICQDEEEALGLHSHPYTGKVPVAAAVKLALPPQVAETLAGLLVIVTGTQGTILML